MTGPGGRAAAGLCPVLSSAGSWSPAGVGDQAAGQTVHHVECGALCSRLCCSPGCPPGSSAHAPPSTELLRAGQGAGGRPGPEQMPRLLPASCLTASCITLFTESPGHGPICSACPAGSSLWEWGGVALLGPQPRTGPGRGHLRRAWRLNHSFPPPPQSWQTSAHVTLHEHGENLEEMGLTFSNGPRASTGVYLLRCLKNHI